MSNGCRDNTKYNNIVLSQMQCYILCTLSPHICTTHTCHLIDMQAAKCPPNYSSFHINIICETHHCIDNIIVLKHNEVMKNIIINTATINELSR